MVDGEAGGCYPTRDTEAPTWCGVGRFALKRLAIPAAPLPAAPSLTTESTDGREDFVAADFVAGGQGHANDLAQPTRSAVQLAALLRGVDAEQRAVGFIGEQVQQAVGALSDVADAVVKVAKDTFAMEFFPLVVEIDAL
jgi:hypothetical protein